MFVKSNENASNNQTYDKTSTYAANLLAHFYKKFKESEVNFKCLAACEKTRAKWLKKIEILKIAKLKMQAV